MSQTKYMMSGGLAFSEAADMKKLQRKALQGWHLKKFSFLGYRLEKGEAQEVVYTIDYRVLDTDDKSEYFEMFNLSGWNHVCSEYNMHIFNAPKGTKPIYTDEDTTKEKYVRLIQPIQTLSLISSALLLLFLTITLTTQQGTIHVVSKWAAMITSIMFVPLVMTLIASYVRKWKKPYQNENYE